MAAGIRIIYHSRRWRRRRHLGHAAWGAQVGRGALTTSASAHGDVDIPASRLWRLAQALWVAVNNLGTRTEAPAPPGDEPSASTESLSDPGRPGPRCLACALLGRVSSG